METNKKVDNIKGLLWGKGWKNSFHRYYPSYCVCCRACKFVGLQTPLFSLSQLVHIIYKDILGHSDNLGI
jgi:hypothetical protein